MRRLSRQPGWPITPETRIVGVHRRRRVARSSDRLVSELVDDALELIAAAEDLELMVLGGAELSCAGGWWMSDEDAGHLELSADGATVVLRAVVGEVPTHAVNRYKPLVTARLSS